MLFSLMVSLLAVESPTDSIPPVTVFADRGVVVSKSDTIRSNHLEEISELIKRSPTVYLGDNGGLGGEKTISLRGMGSAHTAIYIDGIRVGNAMRGQMDLANLNIGGCSELVIDYAQNALSLNTVRPEFSGGKRLNTTVKFSGGSFDTYLPSLKVDYKLDSLSSLTAGLGVVSSGGYRENSDYQNLNANLDYFYAGNRGNLHAKAYLNMSERGTPGSVQWPSQDRQQDNNCFVQAAYSLKVNGIYSFVATTKYANDNLQYLSSWGNSNYTQDEFQLNTAHKLSLGRGVTLGASANVYLDAVESSVYNERRVGTSQSLSALFNTPRFKAGLAVLFDEIFDISHLSRYCASPSVNLSYKITDELTVSAFSRREYRVPTFNELYYTGFGNPDLKPEDCWMNDIDFAYDVCAGNWRFSAKSDLFYNFLTDKITSAPTPSDPNIWLPYNLGSVRTLGADIRFGASSRYCGITFRYCFQDADMPYVSRHSLVVDSFLTYRGWNVSALFTLRAGLTDSYGPMPDWNTLDFYLRKSIFFVSAKNVLDKSYELVSGYPMPGRSFLVGVELKF